ncbi:type 1 glutamine amidotransferase [Motiliproteus sp.]|uniref:type 1 glutamine amidotransferase n=1 Tax=Motiliproteus sp. TaxID=1898955 RepID=UPI003BAC7C38
MKPRVGITQRVEMVAGYDERRDCLDQSWIELLEGLDLIPLPLPNTLNDPADYIDKAGFDGFILTGGNDIAQLPDAKNTAPERDRLEQRVLETASNLNMPVLGVCRGMQMINVYLGGSLIKVSGHIGVRHGVIDCQECEPRTVQVSVPTDEVNSYHGWGMKKGDLGEGLKPIALSEDDCVEAFVHVSLPWLGLMWHPERDKPYSRNDKKLIRELFGA